uniref:Uncharacterized protein n=1 Tax=Onchocerca volvulus TaxID=6282 RepID=A0A8R1TQE6_ONCVO
MEHIEEKFHKTMVSCKYFNQNLAGWTDDNVIILTETQFYEAGRGRTGIGWRRSIIIYLTIRTRDASKTNLCDRQSRI